MPTYSPTDLPTEALTFLSEYHLATLTVLKPDGSPQVTPVGFTYDPELGLLRIISWLDSWKTKHLMAGHDDRVAVSSVDGGRWLTFYGTAVPTTEPDRISEGVRLYAERYRTPKDRDDRVVIEVAVTRVIGRV